MTDKYLTVGKAADVMGCHPETIRRLDRRGILNALRDYRGFRVLNLREILRVKTEREKFYER